MPYLELFVFINFMWGVITIALIPFCERESMDYRKVATVLLITSWVYLFACVPAFRDGIFIPEDLSSFYMGVVMILSIEVWIVILLTLLAIALAKQSHQSEYQSYLLRFHFSLNKVMKPLWFILGLLNMLNAGYYLLFNYIIINN